MEDESKYRKHMRVMLTLDVELKFDDSEWTKFNASDVSWGGVFIETKTPKAIGTYVTVRMPHIEDGVKLELAGNVVRHNKVVGGKPVPGMGIKFSEVDDEAKMLIESIVNRLLSVRDS